MNNKEFEFYKDEVKERWGNTDAYKEYVDNTKNYGDEKKGGLIDEMNSIFGEFASYMNNNAVPADEEVQSLVKKLQDHITENYYTCTKAILSGLGQMYVCDERFKNNIDRHAEGTATFASEAISHYCKA